MLALLLSGCWLEKTTGEPVPLDPRFYEAVEAVQGDPGVGGADSIPFGDYDGATVMVRGTVTSPEEGPVEIDVRTPDPTAEGGVKGHGKIQLEGLGEFELRVPSALGELELQAFQDPDADGPGGADPFAAQKRASSRCSGALEYLCPAEPVARHRALRAFFTPGLLKGPGFQRAKRLTDRLIASELSGDWDVSRGPAGRR